MRKSIYKIFAAAFAVVFMTAAAYGATDTAGHWAESTINQWINRGYIQGYEDGTFRPNNPVTRAEFTALTDRAFSKSGSASAYFSDVNPSDWYYNAVSRGVSAGYISGYGDGTFKPGNNITRQEAAVIIARVLGEGQNEQYANGFSDSYLLSWSKGYVGKCVQLGILKGDPSGSFRPEDNMTRAEAVTALNSALNYYNNNYSYVPDNQGLVKNDGNDNYRDDGITVISSQSYGPNSGKQTLSEPVKITNSSASTKIKNVKFEDTVTVTEDVNKLYLENVTADKVVVKGATYVYLTNSDIRTIEVDAPKAVTIENTSRSSVTDVVLYSAATVYDNYASSSYGFTNVKIDSSVKSNTNFTLRGGTFSNVTVNAESVRVTLRSGTVRNLYLTSTARSAYVSLNNDTTVNYAEIYGRSSSVVGDGKISKAYVGATGVTLSRRPNTLTGNYTPYYDSNDRDRDNNSSNRYTYTFKVENSNGYPVKGADVRVDGTTYTTDSNGEVSFRLYSGKYDYRITHTDFNNKTGTISASNSSGTFTLTGGRKYSADVTVKDDSGNVLNGVSVKIGTYTGTTGANGIVTINNIESGYYPVSTSKTNYGPYSGYMEISRNSSKSLSVTMKNNIPTTGTLSFTVNKDKDVSGVTGGKIDVINASTGVGLPTKDFTFGEPINITNLPAGNYLYEITATDYTTVYSTQVTVTAGQTTQVTKTMNRVSYSQVNVTIYVKDASGNPISGAAIILDDVVSSLVTDGTGQVVLNNISVGGHSLKVTHNGFEDLETTITVADYPQAQTFTLTMTEETQQTGTIAVTVVKDEDNNIKISGAKVIITKQGESASSETTTDGNGVASFTSMAHGTYDIQVTADNYQGKTVTGVGLNSNEKAIEIELTSVSTTGTLWVKVEDSNNQLLQGAEVTIAEVNRSATTNSGGAAEFANLAFGNYNITVDSINGESGSDTVSFDYTGQNKTITLTPDTPSGAPLNQGALAESAEMMLPTPQIAVDPVVPVAEEPKVETPKKETPKAERPLVVLPVEETPVQETPKAEVPKAEEPKVETPKPEEPKVERPLVVLPVEETPALETPKTEEPKVEEPKSEVPKVEEPKTETPNNQNGLVPVNPPVKEAPSIQVNDRRGNDKQPEQRPQPQTGSIIISVSGPQSATVTIAGRTITVSGTAIINNVPVGSYSYSAYANGYTSTSGSVTVTAGSNTVNIHLSQESASVPFNFGETPEFNMRAE